MFTWAKTWGGVEKICLNLNEALEAHGVATELVLVGAARRTFKSTCVRRLPSRHLWLSLLMLRKLAIGFAPTHIIAHKGFEAILAALLVRTFLGRRPRVVWVQHVPIEIAEMSGPKRLVRATFSRMAALLVDNIGAISDGIKQELMSLLGRPIVRLHNPVSLQPSSHHDSGLIGGTLEIVSVGRLDYQKNYPLAIAIASELKRSGRSFRWRVYGDGPEREQLEELIATEGLEDCFLLMGFVTQPWTLVPEGAVLVLTSHWEGYPTVILEAFVNGCAVVSRNCPTGPSDMISHPSLGAVIDDKDPKAFASAIVACAGRTRSQIRVSADSLLHLHRPERVVEEYLATVLDV